MELRFATLTALFLICFSSLQAQKFKRTAEEEELDKTGLNIMFFYEAHSYSSYFDSDGNKIGNIDIDIEKIREQVETDTITVLNPANWTFDINKKKYGLHAEYFFDKDNMIYVTMPFETNTLNQQITYKIALKQNVNYQDIVKNKYAEQSKSFLSYIAMGGEYFTYKKDFFNSVLGEIRIPGGSQGNIPASEVTTSTVQGSTGQDSIILNTPLPGQNKEFLSDGAFELHLGTSTGYNFRKAKIQTTFKYLLRGEELSDQIYNATSLYIRTMQEAFIKLGMNYYHSLDDAPAGYYFDYTKTPIYDRTLNFDMGFQVYIKKLIIDLNMQIPVWGKNSASNSVFTMKLGWHI